MIEQQLILIMEKNISLNKHSLRKEENEKTITTITIYAYYLNVSTNNV